MQSQTKDKYKCLIGLNELYVHRGDWSVTMSRDHALDATRTFAIWLMISCHVARLINKTGFQFSGTPNVFSNLSSQFSESDIDSSASLSYEEFAAIFPGSSTETLSKLFKKADTSESGYLTFREFYYGADNILIRPGWMEFSLDIEPLCQALFMSMVGVSLLYSLQVTAKPEQWNRRQIRRAGELYLVGFVFFIFQYGIQWPWMFIGHGILLSIASAILLCIPLVRNKKAPYITMALLWTGTLLLNIYDIKIGFINAGNGPFLPHALLSVFGLIAGGVLFSESKKNNTIYLVVMGLFVAISLYCLDFMDYFSYPDPLSLPYGRRDFSATYHLAGGDGISQIWTLLSGGATEKSNHEYYNYTATSVPILMALCTGIYMVFHSLGTITKKLAPLWLVGRHSLGIYILHLILIALTTVIFGSQRPFKSGIEVQLCFLIIVLICYGYAYRKEKQ